MIVDYFYKPYVLEIDRRHNILPFAEWLNSHFPSILSGKERYIGPFNLRAIAYSLTNLFYRPYTIKITTGPKITNLLYLMDNEVPHDRPRYAVIFHGRNAKRNALLFKLHNDFNEESIRNRPYPSEPMMK